MKTTITEALADLKTIDKRIQKKREFVLAYLLRQEMQKDPLEKEGGSVNAINAELQSIGDLFERKIVIRAAINKANTDTSIEIQGIKRTINDWLVWRREVAASHGQLLNEINGKIQSTRQDAIRKGLAVVSGQPAANPTDVLVNLNEQELAKEIEQREEILGVLDGQLSLKNATILIEV